MERYSPAEHQPKDFMSPAADDDHDYPLESHLSRNEGNIQAEY